MKNKTMKEAQEIVEKMKRNSRAWAAASAVERMELEQKNQRCAEELRSLGIPAQYDGKTGVWYVKLYDLF